MIPIWDAMFCVIDITNICGMGCLYCSRYDRHIRDDQRYFMGNDEIERAVRSLKGWPSRIGIVGGEPTMHPHFPEVCELLRRIEVRRRLVLFTAGGRRYRQFHREIKETFSYVVYNEHNPRQREVCRHQPTTIAIGDLVKDEAYRNQLIDNCWVQHQWCPVINRKGGFFCEIAASLDFLLDGPGGYPVEPGWWQKKPPEFQDQVDRSCHLCGMAVPFERPLLKEKREYFTKSVMELFRDHKLRCLREGDVIILDRELSVDEMEKTKLTWDPGNYRGDAREDRPKGWSCAYEDDYPHDVVQ